MRLFRAGETGRYTYVLPFTGRTGHEVRTGNLHDVAFEGTGLSVGMVKSSDTPTFMDAAVILHLGLDNPTWGDLEGVQARVNRAWRAAFGDTCHVYFEGASMYGDTIWLAYGS